MQYTCFSIQFLSAMEKAEEIAASMQSGSFELSPTGLINKLIDLCVGEFHELGSYIIVFFCIGLLTTIVRLLEQNLNSGVSNMAFFACYGGAAATSVKCFSVCLDYASDVISEMTDFITKLSPMLMTLIVTSGKSISVAAFNPVLSASVYVISIICRRCILPLASYSVILTITDNIGDNVQISGLCRLTSSASRWILTLVFTLFTGICAIYGFATPSLDAVSAKTVKFAVGSLVPVVGGFLSETLETVITSGKMMKNTVGSAGLVVLCSICVAPIIKIGAMALIIRLSSAITEPVSDIRISKLLNGISSAVTILFGMVATVAVLFLITIGIILASTG